MVDIGPEEKVAEAGTPVTAKQLDSRFGTFNKILNDNGGARVSKGVITPSIARVRFSMRICWAMHTSIEISSGEILRY